jgi:hypothetical protein
LRTIIAFDVNSSFDIDESEVIMLGGDVIRIGQYSVVYKPVVRAKYPQMKLTPRAGDVNRRAFDLREAAMK